MYCKVGGTDSDLPSPLGIRIFKGGGLQDLILFRRRWVGADEKGGWIQFSPDVRGWDRQVASLRISTH